MRMSERSFDMAMRAHVKEASAKYAEALFAAGHLALSDYLEFRQRSRAA